eukprot:4337301-Prymnesium_polylepis.1
MAGAGPTRQARRQAMGPCHRASGAMERTRNAVILPSGNFHAVELWIKSGPKTQDFLPQLSCACLYDAFDPAAVVVAIFIPTAREEILAAASWARRSANVVFGWVRGRCETNDALRKLRARALGSHASGGQWAAIARARALAHARRHRPSPTGDTGPHTHGGARE